MLNQHQFYPAQQYHDWIFGKCSDRIESGEYKTLLAISKGSLAGECVYSLLAQGIVEIKNFRIDEEYKNRDLGHFLLRQIEVETNAKVLTLDVTVDNFSGVQFFIRNGFNIDGKKRIYDPRQFEYLMSKKLRPQ